MPKKRPKFWDRRRYPKRKRYSTRPQSRNYDDPVYKDWRRSIYKRDGYRCQWPGCKCRGGRLHVHHILRWADYPSKRYDKSNGITLCKEHHDRVKGKEDDYARMFLDILLQRMKREE
jgi:5-methylcytosine-specific restriction endonuclease McrA